MKKLLIATAAMAVVAGAQAQSSVTVYGTFDAAYVSNDSGASSANKTNKINGGTLTSDRIGFKGVEDLGGGLTAQFQYESGMYYTDPNAGTGGNTLAGTQGQPGNGWGARRDTFVGLASKTLGDLKVGSMYTPAFRFAGWGDVNGTNVFGTNLSQGMIVSSTADAAPSDSATGAYKLSSNAAQYTSPTYNGLKLTVYHAADETADDKTDKIASYQLDYAVGKFEAVVVDQTINVSNTAKAKSKGYGIGYDFGFAKVRATTQKNDPTNATASNDISVNKISAVVPVNGQIDIMLGYATMKEDAAGSLYSASTSVEGKAKVTHLGAVYKFSKRTNAYIDYAKLTQDSNSKFGLSTAVATAGLEPTQLAVGVRHAF